MGISTDRVLHRRPGLRGARAVAVAGRPRTSPERLRRLGGIELDVIAVRSARRGTRTGLPGRAGDARAAPPTRRSAVTTSGGARASCTCSTPRQSSCCSTPRGRTPLRRVQANTPKKVDDQLNREGDARCAACSSSCRTAMRPPVPLDEVESASLRHRHALRDRCDVVRVDLGQEAHQTLAIAMNSPRRASRTPARVARTPTATCAMTTATCDAAPSSRSRAGRFGVTSHYLTSTPTTCRSRSPKVPSRGRVVSCRAFKVYPWIAAHPAFDAGRRVDLAAPTPRHLLDRRPQAQLIHDLKNANPQRARAREARRRGRASEPSPPACRSAHADVVLISGHDGGTGAAPLTSLKHAGTALGARPRRDPADPRSLNGLRDRITVQVDGADEDRSRCRGGGAARRRRVRLRDRARSIVSGCVMMRVCHLDTCPVGVATQNPLLRERFSGKPEFVVNVLRIHRRAGARDPGRARIPHARAEAIGQVQLLDTSKPRSTHWKARWARPRRRSWHVPVSPSTNSALSI